MNIGPVLQTIGIFFTATGSILVIAKLWQEYFRKMKKWAEFYAWCLNEYKKVDNKLRNEDSEFLKKVLESEVYDIAYKKWMAKFIKARADGSKKTEEQLEKIIIKHYFTDKNFLYFGVSLIVLGGIIQIIGVWIQ